jgi:hypothetical protein
MAKIGTHQSEDVRMTLQYNIETVENTISGAASDRTFFSFYSDITYDIHYLLLTIRLIVTLPPCDMIVLFLSS